MTGMGSPVSALARVDVTHTRAVKFDVQKMLDEFPGEWAECEQDGGSLQEFVRETVAELGLDLFDYEWAIPEPQHDDFETDVHFD